MRNWFLPALAIAGAAMSVPSFRPALDAKSDVHTYLTSVQFTAADLARLENGEVIARADSPSDAEMQAIAAVKVRVPRDQVLAYYGQMVAYVDGKVTLGFGKFSTPPSAADVKALTLDAGDLAALKACRSGSCDMRLGGTALTAVQA